MKTTPRAPVPHSIPTSPIVLPAKSKTPVVKVPADGVGTAVNVKANNALAGELKALTPSRLSGSFGFEAAEVAAYEARNKKTATGKYPTLEKVLADPDAFVADVTARFEKQKGITPQNPYAIDFSDYALPVLEQVDQALAAELTMLQKRYDSTGMVGKLTGGADELQKGLT